MKFKIYIVISFSAIYSILNSQNTYYQAKVKDIVSSGGTVTTGPGTWMSYSIGDIAINTVSISNMTASSNGFQQPSGKGRVQQFALPITNTINKSILIYPNPTNDQITIKINEPNLEQTICTIYNITGQAIVSTEFNKHVQKIDLSKFPSSIYLMQLSQNGTIIYISKIQKQ